jgi:hypothetical protein
MVHIVFSEKDAEVLNAAMDLDETLKGQLVIIKDDYSVGPIGNIYDDDGKEKRKQWWSAVWEGGDFEKKKESDVFDDNQLIDELVVKMQEDENELIWIWAAQNKVDVCGYYWLLHFMKPFQGRVQILYLNNLPFINEKGNIFYPVWLHEIPAKEFLKAKKLAREITLSEFEVDPDEWMKLCAEDKGVRILEGGKKLVQNDYSFYDNDLKRYVTNDWQKGSKIINNYISKAKHTTGEAYLLWRLKELIAAGAVDVQGKVANMKDFEIKWKSAGA